MEDHIDTPDGPESAAGASARLIDTVKELLSSALSSDPGNTSVDLGGCYIAPLIELFEAVGAGTEGAALDPLIRKVVAMEESLAARARDVDSGSAAISPVRVIGSLRELENLASDSIVCSPWAPSSVYQTDMDGRWYEPGTEETLPAGAIWELMTGSDSGIVMDEDRRVWVLFDAGSPVPKPLPANDHGYLTMANAGRAERFITHPTLAEARSVIEALCAQPGGAPGHLAIRYRAGGDSVFRGITPIPPGTTPGQLPWKQADAGKPNVRELVRALNRDLGPTLVTVMAGEIDRTLCTGWAEDDGQEPSPEALQRLQFAYEQFQLIAGSQGTDVARLWFMGMNPWLGDESPIEAIRTGRFREVTYAAHDLVNHG